MTSDSSSVLQPGVFVPILTPFLSDGSESVDIDEFKAYVARLARAGCGLVLSGTLGEGNLLSRDEKKGLVQAAREVATQEALDGKVPIIAGINGDSTAQCVTLAKDAAEAGADAVVVVAPAYYAFVYGKNKSALKTFFTDIADASPVPLLIYNIPFASGGIDLDPDFLMDIAEHQNIAGVKLTCYSIAKGHRVALHVSSPEYRRRHPLPFLVLPGGSDYMLPALVGRQHGCVSGPANIYPRVMMKLFKTSSEALQNNDMKRFQEAQELQDLVTASDAVINRVGFLGIKTAMNIHVRPKLGLKGPRGTFRAPLPASDEWAVSQVTEGLRKILELEDSLH